MWATRALEMHRSWNNALCGRRIGVCGCTAVREDGRTFFIFCFHKQYFLLCFCQKADTKVNSSLVSFRKECRHTIQIIGGYSTTVPGSIWCAKVFVICASAMQFWQFDCWLFFCSNCLLSCLLSAAQFLLTVLSFADTNATLLTV